MESWKVVKAIVLESAAFSVAQKYMRFLLNIPRTLLKAWFNFHLKAISVCFVIVITLWKLLPWRKSCDPSLVSPSLACEPQPEPQPESAYTTAPAPSNTEEPKCEDIVKSVKKLRNHAVMTLEHFTGDDLFWDLPILTAKSERFNRALREGDRRKIDASRKALEAHGVFEPKPKSKAAYDQLMREAQMDIYEFPDPAPNSTEDEEMQHCGQVDESADVKLKDVNSNGDVILKDVDPGNTKEKTKKKVNFSLDNATSSNKPNGVCRHDHQLAMQNKLLRSRLNITNCKLEEMLRSSNSILEEVMRLNEQFSKLTTVSSKMTSLQHELGLGKQLLWEVEEDRNEMKLKLLALEKLIKEEEEYLDDLSCESGYEEVEHFCDSTDEM